MTLHELAEQEVRQRLAELPTPARIREAIIKVAEAHAANVNKDLVEALNDERTKLFSFLEQMSTLESLCLSDYRHSDAQFKGFYLRRACDLRQIIDQLIKHLDVDILAKAGKL